MTQDRRNIDHLPSEQDSNLQLPTEQAQSYRSWRAPASVQAEALSRFAATPAKRMSNVGWGAAVAACLMLAVALLTLNQGLEEGTPEGVAKPGLATLALHDVRLPPKPDFPAMTSVRVPTRAPSIPRLNQISLSALTEKETL